MNSKRLPYKLACYVIEYKIHWAIEWNNILQQVQGTVNNISFLNISWENIAEKISFTESAVNIAKAKHSQYHDLYPKLDFKVIRTLLNNFKSWSTSLILKARGGMLNLNSRSFLSNLEGLCTLCNLKASANILHFIGVCSVYNSIKFQYFGSIHLEEEYVINLLNGAQCFALYKYKYIETCLNYRNLIINEFN